MKFYRKIIVLIIALFINSNAHSQNVYTSIHGAKLLPGHLAIIITIDSNYVCYELYDHWYTGCISKFRNITVKLDSLTYFNKTNDSINIKIIDSKVYLTDKKYKINKKVKHRKLCNSPEIIRKISYACDLALINNLQPRSLYNWDDINLNDFEFKKLVDNNLEKIIKKQ